MSARRDLLLIGALFTALVLFIIFGPARQPPVPPAIPTTRSTADAGAQLLYEWVGRMGYAPRRLEFRDYEVDDDADILVILSPTEPISEGEARLTLDWVERGGTLILADDTSNLLGADNALLEELQVVVAASPELELIEQVEPLQPAFSQPPVGAIEVRAGRYLQPGRDDYAALAGTPEAPLLAGVRHGSGYIYLSSAVHPFTNDGLRNEQNARLMLNLLRRAPAGGVVIFDEIHHGYTRPPTPTTAVMSSPWGWAGLYALLVVALYLALGGRRFGRPIPLREEVTRRSSAEYIESMADLLQRGGKRAYIQRHYLLQLKRRLARPYGISPQLSDEEFVAEYRRARSDQDAEILQRLLARLRAGQGDDAALVRLVAEADAFLNQQRTQERR
jgi:Domain of unknown function (DUF4350)